MLKIVLAIVAALYGVSPVDIVPELLLGWAGWIDDIIIFYLLWRFVFRARRQPYQWKGQPGTSGNEDRNGQRSSAYDRREASDAANSDGPRSPHEVLGVSPNAAAEEIKQAYKKLAGQYHPDKVQHLGEEFRALAEKRFKEIQAAYDALTRK
jgi:DnaJ like chaperone protein